MRRFATYLMAIVLLAVMTCVIAPLVGLDLSVGAGATGEPGTLIQAVNRTHKGDRLPVPAAEKKVQPPQQSPIIMVGCEPAFSPLSAFARANFAGRCVG